MKEGVDQQDEQDEENRHPHDEEPEAAGPLFKVGGRGLDQKAVGNPSQFRILPGAADQHLRRAADHRGPEEHGVAGRQHFSLFG